MTPSIRARTIESSAFIFAMRNYHKFCSVCGGRLRKKGKQLICSCCPFVNYRNPRPTATAIIVNRNKILLVKRRNTPFRGWWDLPGGFINRGEPSEKALEREVREESGLRIKSRTLFGLYHGIYPSVIDPFHVLSVVYIVKPQGVVCTVDKKEVSAVEWFSKKELPKRIAFDSNQRVIKDFLKIWK